MAHYKIQREKFERDADTQSESFTQALWKTLVLTKTTDWIQLGDVAPRTAVWDQWLREAKEMARTADVLEAGRVLRWKIPEDVQVSKKMSRILRHSAEDEGLKLGPGGYVSVQDLLQTNTMKSLKVTFPELRAIVTSNDKQRFSLIPISEAPSPTAPSTDTSPDAPAPPAATSPDGASAYLIRANQGHSISSVSSASLLTPLTASTPDLPAACVHGTTAAAWPAILASGGLRPMGRNHVHLAAGLPAGFEALEEDGGDDEAETRQPVISGMRSSSRVLVYVDLARAMAAGVVFYRSANNVILTEGDAERGKLLGVEFFKRVEDRKAKAVLVRDGVLVGDGGAGMKADGGEGRGGGRAGRGGYRDGRRGGAGEAF
ncbi:tRNA 2'-phosphotransferase [Neofusicoccum ribis]|uniref:2'-phosphotransferase n=1 Tax=Neofusicoccum ribis TaxID=45134 RepID=A0ABR3SHY7_9PEZI